VAAGYIQMRASHGSLAMTALSHLLFFDALGAFLVVAVDICRNFEVWNRSSVRTPFGLERAEVLAGLAMSIILLFMGLDLISHGLQHLLENAGGHEPHHAHEHERLAAGEIDFSALLAVLVTLFSAYLLGNHKRVAKTMRVPFLEWLPKVARNPSHLLTLSCSGLLLILPLVDLHTYKWVDPTLSFSMALFMIWLGGGLAYILGRMLLMSYSDPGVKDVVSQLEADANVAAVEEAKVWQVHYGLCMANFKLRVRSLDNVEELRKKVGMLVRNGLGGGYGEGSKGVKWDVNVEAILDRD
jgi:divalent metal cation (Fe/Co/Zn/Cd) transporter